MEVWLVVAAASWLGSWMRWSAVVVMAVANIAGSVLGTSQALKHGAGLVRRVFMLVVSLLILKTGVNAYAGT